MKRKIIVGILIILVVVVSFVIFHNNSSNSIIQTIDVTALKQVESNKISISEDSDLFIGAKQLTNIQSVGDVDSDGIVTNKDAQIIQMLSTGKLDENCGYKISQADLDYNGVIEQKDAIIALQKSLGRKEFNRLTVDDTLNLQGYQLDNTTFSEVQTHWQSDNTEVISIDEQGRITALRSGTATITGTYTYGKELNELTGTLYFYVAPKPDLSMGLQLMYNGEGGYEFPDSTSQILGDVNQDRIISELDAKLILGASSNNGENIYSNFNFNRENADINKDNVIDTKDAVLVEQKRNENNVIFLTKSNYAELLLNVYNEGLEKLDSNNVIFESSNTDIATIDEDGWIIAKDVGQVVITATSNNQTGYLYLEFAKKEIPQVYIGNTNSTSINIQGDVDNDGIVTNKDAQIIQMLSTGKLNESNGYSYSKADMNGDGVVTTIDADIVLRKSEGKQGCNRLLVGEELTLKGYLLNETSFDENVVTWESSDSQVISVNEQGKITPLKSGNAIITATHIYGKENNKITGSIYFEVIEQGNILIKAQHIRTQDGNYSLEDKTSTLKGDVNQDGIISGLDYYIMNAVLTGHNLERLNAVGGYNESNADINDDGTVDSSDLLMLNKMMMENSNINLPGSDYAELTLQAWIDASDELDDELISWTSSNTKVATVDNSGLVKAEKPGEVIIIVKTKPEYYSSLGNIEGRIYLKFVRDDKFDLLVSNSSLSNVIITEPFSEEILNKRDVDVNSDGFITSYDEYIAEKIWKQNNSTINTVPYARMIASKYCLNKLSKDITGIQLYNNLNIDNVIEMDNEIAYNINKIENKQHIRLVALRRLDNRILLEEEENAPKIIWKSSNEFLAEVDNEGNVETIGEIEYYSSSQYVDQIAQKTSETKISKGEPVCITASTEDGYEASIYLYVTIPVEGIGVTSEEDERFLKYYIDKGQTAQIVKPLINPINATNQKINWNSADTGKATVDENGNITGVEYGTTKISATTEDGGYTVEYTINVSKPITSITLEKNNIEVEVGKTFWLNPRLTPSQNIIEPNILNWEIGDEDIVDIGYEVPYTNLYNPSFYAKKIGTTTITVRTPDGQHSDTCNVTVKDKAENETITVNSIRVDAEDEDNILVGDIFGVEVDVSVITKNLEVGVTQQSFINWSIEDESILENKLNYVNGSSSTNTNTKLGIRVRAKKAGTTKVRATSKDGKSYKECTITVKDNNGKLEIETNKELKIAEDSLQDRLYIEDIKQNTTIKTIMNLVNTNGTKEFYKDNQIITDENTKIATGMKLKISLNDEEKTYNMVVPGDLNGDGNINDTDLLMLARYKAGFETEKNLIKREYLRATDIVKNNKFAEDTDLLKLARILVKLDTF